MTLLSADTFDEKCSTRQVLDQVTSRWGTLVLAALVTGPHRFAALRDKIGGISEKMLAQTLKQLVRAGLVERSVEATVLMDIIELGWSSPSTRRRIVRTFSSSSRAAASFVSASSRAKPCTSCFPSRSTSRAFTQ